MLKMILICYCAFAYGFEFSNIIDFLSDEMLEDAPFSNSVIFLATFVVFLLSPIVMPLNWLINTIKIFWDR